ncbi:unnamed protein product, partial [Ectocarpus sp. 12 AP-2014]
MPSSPKTSSVISSKRAQDLLSQLARCSSDTLESTKTFVSANCTFEKVSVRPVESCRHCHPAFCQWRRRNTKVSTRWTSMAGWKIPTIPQAGQIGTVEKSHCPTRPTAKVGAGTTTC